MPFSIDIPQLPALLVALAAYPSIAAPILEDASNAALLSLIPDLASYPAAPANSTYRRTGTLGRAWTAARPEFAPMSSGFEATIGNATPYAVYVQGEWQPKQNSHWTTADEVIARRQAAIEAYFEAALTRIAERIDGSI